MKIEPNRKTIEKSNTAQIQSKMPLLLETLLVSYFNIMSFFSVFHHCSHIIYKIQTLTSKN